MLHISLNDTQRAELRQLARQAIGRVSERAHFVLLSEQGYAPPAIGTLLGYSAATVRTGLGAYQAAGCSGLEDAPRSGRPVQVPNLLAVVQAQASQPPPNAGYLQTCWTVALLGWHLLERFGLRVRGATWRRALHRVGFHWTRPKLTPAHRHDPPATEKEALWAEVLAKAEATVIAEDECDIHLLAVLRAMWQRVGEQGRIPTPGQNAKRGIFGGVNVRTGEWFSLVTARKRGVEFLNFLTRLLTAYPRGPIYVSVDNASIHTSHAVKAWLTAHPRLPLVYLPTYSGHRLNPVEKIWWDLKAHIAANRCFKSLAELEAALDRYCISLTRLRVLRLINSEVVRAAQAAAKK